MVSRLTRLFRRQKEDTDCHEVRALSSDYIDGELDQAGTDRVKTHLDWCPPCNAFVNTLRATVAMLRDGPRHKASDELRQRIREKVRDSSER